MPNKPPAVTQADTIAALLKRSRRSHVPIRKTFVQQGKGKVRDPGPIASLVSNHDERALDLYLLAHAAASADPFDVVLSANTWARALGMSPTASARSAVSKAFRRLDLLGLIQRHRAGSRARVTLLDEAGHGDVYVHPAGRREPYLKVPHAYWEQQWHVRLRPPGKALLLIALSVDDGFSLPIEKGPDWYGISADTVQRGLNELERHQGIDVDVWFKKAPLSPLGYTEARHYTLKAPFWSAAPSYRVGDEAARLMAEPSDAVPPRAVPDPGTVGVAVYDATCLFSKHGRYLLLGFAVHGVAVARWSRRLLEESAASLAGQLRGDALEDLGRWLKTEAELVRDGLVEGYERWLDHVELPDPDDRHVVAAAIECGATRIVTGNLRDFPDDRLAPLGIKAVDPDDFALACIDANPVAAALIVTGHRKPEEFLQRLEVTLPRTARYLSELVT